MGISPGLLATEWGEEDFPGDDGAQQEDNREFSVGEMDELFLPVRMRFVKRTLILIKVIQYLMYWMTFTVQSEQSECGTKEDILPHFIIRRRNIYELALVDIGNLLNSAIVSEPSGNSLKVRSASHWISEWE